MCGFTALKGFWELVSIKIVSNIEVYFCREEIKIMPLTSILFGILVLLLILVFISFYKRKKAFIFISISLTLVYIIMAYVLLTSLISSM